MNTTIATNPDSIEEFRREVQAFFRTHLKPELRERVLAGNYLQKDEYLAWQKTLGARGWGAPNWPVEHGGAGWSAVQKYVFEDESARMGAPIPVYLRNGLHIVGPLIIRFGREDQQARYLPRILHGDELWAQGFSEPDAGSDLAALRCAATREGDTYIVNGTKIWTSLAHLSAHCLLLVRTGSEGSKHQGITILLADLRLPGITIRPINAIDGYYHLNQVTFDNVRVPVDCRLGEEGSAWKMIGVGLEAERLFLADIGLSKSLLRRLRFIAARMPRGDGMLSGQPWFNDRLGRLEIRLSALDGMVLRLIHAPASITASEASMLKLRGTELAQDISQLMSEAAGMHALPYHPDVLADGWQDEPVGPAFAATLTPFYLFWRKATISGGTSEIQKNIIARSLFDGTRSMNNWIPEGQALLFDTAVRFIDEQYTPQDRQASLDSPGGCRPAIWRQFAEMGWLGLPFPSRCGGFDGTPLDVLTLMQAFGRGLVVEPYLPSVMLAGRAILHGGSKHQQESLLVPLISGATRLAAAFHEESGGYLISHVATTARPAAGGYVLDGCKSVVLGAVGADTLVVSARTAGNPRDNDGISLFLVDAHTEGLTLRPYVTIDGRSAADVTLKNVHIPGDALIGPEGQAGSIIEQAVDDATLACIGEAVGVLGRAQEMTVDYLGIRKQFGQPLSAFQVLRHRAVDIHIAQEELRSLALSAAGESDPARRSRLLSAAKIHIGESGTRAILDTIQLHGGIGMTEEYALGHYVRRFTALDRLFGGAAEHLNRYQRLEPEPAGDCL